MRLFLEPTENYIFVWKAKIKKNLLQIALSIVHKAPFKIMWFELPDKMSIQQLRFNHCMSTEYTRSHTQYSCGSLHTYLA